VAQVQPIDRRLGIETAHAHTREREGGEGTRAESIEP
jgi:hypothetical protein